MTKTNDDWLGDIHDRMADFEVDEPAGLWDDIRSAVPKPEANAKTSPEPETLNEPSLEPHESSEPSARPSVLWLWPRRVAVAAAVAAGVFATYRLVPGEDAAVGTDATPVVAQTPSGRTPEPSAVGHAASTQVSESSPSDGAPQLLASANVKAGTVASASRPTAHGTEDNTHAAEYSDAEEGPATYASRSKTAESETRGDASSTDVSRSETPATENSRDGNRKSDIPRTETPRRSGSLSSGSLPGNNLIAYSRPRTDSRLAVGVYTSGMTSSQRSSTLYNLASVTASGPDDSDWTDDPLLGILLYNQGREIDIRMKHHLPITTGVSVEYRFDRHWGVETGLTYSYLSSDITDGSESHYVAGQQKLHYAGIPVAVKYNILPSKRFDLYTSAGLTVAKCVSGSTTQTYVVDRKEQESHTEGVTEKPVQLSAKAVVGVQYNITDFCGLYVEPGVVYHFDDNSSLNTIYKDKPLNFNLNLGLRFSLGR